MSILRVTVASLLLSACGGPTAFRVTDRSFVPAKLARLPEVFWDQAPTQPYRAVGILTITLPDGTRREEIAEQVALKGKDVGCDVVVSSAAHKKAELDGSHFRLVHDDGGNGRPSVEQSTPEVAHEFICGKWQAATTGV